MKEGFDPLKAAADATFEAVEAVDRAADDTLKEVVDKGGQAGEAIVTTGVEAIGSMNEAAGKAVEEANNRIFEAGEAILGVGKKKKEG